MIKVLAIMPTYNANGELLNSNVSVEIVLATGEVGNASFTLGSDEIDFLAIGDSIRQKVLQGLAENTEE